MTEEGECERGAGEGKGEGERGRTIGHSYMQATPKDPHTASTLVHSGLDGGGEV